MIPPSLNQHRDRIRRLMGSILGEPVYICFTSEIGLTPHVDIAGVAALGISALIKERMPDEYIEPRPAVAITDGPLTDGRFPDLIASSMLSSIVLHEFAHVVAGGWTAASIPMVDREGLPTLAPTPPSRWPSHAGPFRWLGHDAPFIRALCHLHHRAYSRGYSIDLSAAFLHDRYDLPPVGEFLAALGTEPGDLSLQPIADVMHTPAPSEFQQLWTDAVVRSLQCLNVKENA